jgi:hypothetical protein
MVECVPWIGTTSGMLLVQYPQRQGDMQTPCVRCGSMSMRLVCNLDMISFSHTEALDSAEVLVTLPGSMHAYTSL